MIFSQLKIYQISHQLESELYLVVCQIPNHKFENACGQILRSSSSISANIVEGCGKQYYKKEFIRFLNNALGFSDETQHHLQVLFNKKLLAEKTFIQFAKRYKNLSVRILNLINCLKK